MVSVNDEALRRRCCRGQQNTLQDLQKRIRIFDLLLSGHLSEETENQIHSRKMMKLAGHSRHYKEIYRLHNTEVIDFFRRHAPESLYSGRLEDPDKWKRLGEFLGVQVLEGYKSHENPSKR